MGAQQPHFQPANYVLQDDIVIGIDLGTTYSCVSYFYNNKVFTIPDKNGAKTQASYVYFDKSGGCSSGNIAKEYAVHDPQNCVFNSKRLLNKLYGDPELMKEQQYLSFHLTKDSSSNHVKIKIPNRENLISPEEVSSKILCLMKSIAENELKLPIKNAVVTVPAYFNDGQRKATKEAGKLAGLNILRLVNEPTAAALAYGIECLNENEQKYVLIYDLGGGTFDISLLKISQSIYKVVAINGDCHLGGEDFDNLLVSYIEQKFRQKTGCHNLMSDVRAVKKLKKDCEKLKIQLSQSFEVIYTLESNESKEPFNIHITRTDLETLCMPLIQKTMNLVTETLEEAKINKNSIDSIVMIGGSTRMPLIYSTLKNYFNKNPYNSINPDEAVAYGAAVVAAKHQKGSAEKFADLSLHDVVPLTIGIKGKGEELIKKIKRNTPYPVEAVEYCTTSYDYQKCINIPIYQGMRPKAIDNHFVGNYQLNNLTKLKKGKVKATVKLSVDADGVLSLKALEENTNNYIEVVVINEESKVSEEEIQKALAEAEKNKITDLIVEKKFIYKSALIYHNKLIGKMLKYFFYCNFY